MRCVGTHKKFVIGGRTLVLSIQAGEAVHCSPRENLPGLSDYDSVEVAMWWEGSKVDAWVRPTDLGLTLDGLPDWPKPDEGAPPYQVVGWVPQVEVRNLERELRIKELEAKVAELEKEAEVVKPGRLTRKRRLAILSGVMAMEADDDWDYPDPLYWHSPDIIAVYEFLGMKNSAAERRELVRDVKQYQREQKREEDK